MAEARTVNLDSLHPDMLACCICDSPFDLEERKPCLLPCRGQHRLCPPCIAGIRLANRRIEFPCPACREIVAVANVPDDRLLTQILAKARLQQPQQKWCVACKKMGDQMCEEASHLLFNSGSMSALTNYLLNAQESNENVLKTIQHTSRQHADLISYMIEVKRALMVVLEGLDAKLNQLKNSKQLVTEWEAAASAASSYTEEETFETFVDKSKRRATIANDFKKHQEMTEMMHKVFIQTPLEMDLTIEFTDKNEKQIVNRFGDREVVMQKTAESVITSHCLLPSFQDLNLRSLQPEEIVSEMESLNFETHGFKLSLKNFSGSLGTVMMKIDHWFPRLFIQELARECIKNPHNPFEIGVKKMAFKTHCCFNLEADSNMPFLTTPELSTTRTAHVPYDIGMTAIHNSESGGFSIGFEFLLERATTHNLTKRRPTLFGQIVSGTEMFDTFFRLTDNERAGCEALLTWTALDEY